MNPYPDTTAAVREGKRRRRAAITALIAGAIGSTALALSATGAFSAFVASITNDTNTAATGYLTMQEQSVGGTATVTCNSTDAGGLASNIATCSTINKFGGSMMMVPGNPVTANITIKNTGTVSAKTFTLTPGTQCTTSVLSGAPSSGGTPPDLCAKLNLVITSGSTSVYTGTLADLAKASPIDLLKAGLGASVDAGTSVPFTFTLTLDASADATYQGLQSSMPLAWTFTSS